MYPEGAFRTTVLTVWELLATSGAFMCLCVLLCGVMLHSVPLHIRVSPDTRQRLQRLRSERHLNVGSWLRALIDQALDREFGSASTAVEEPVTPVASTPPDPLPGWTPAKITDGVWGARFQGDTHTLPSKLEGLIISVTAKSWDSWDATITEVVERFPNLILVRAQKPDSRGSDPNIIRYPLNP